MERDRFGNYIDTGTGNLIKSSQLRARSTVNYQLPVEADEYDEYLFEEPRAINRRSDMNRLKQEENRRGRQPETHEDREITIARAYPVSRYRMDVPRLTPSDPEPRKLMTRRTFTYTAKPGVGLTLFFGGLFIKSRVDEVSEREARGQFGFTTQFIQCGHHDSATHKTELSAWMTSDYRVHFLQTSGDEKDTKEVATQSLITDYHGSLDNVDLTFEFEQINHKYSVVLTLHSDPDLMWQFNDNGQYFV